jgi:Na+-driven multidrug efflux pump
VSTPPRRPAGPSPHLVAAVLLVLVGAALLVAGAYLPRALTDELALQATANGVLRLLGFGSIGAAAVMLVAGRARRSQGDSGSDDAGR